MLPLLLQIADSAFPTGGYAHSLGLEALRQLGHLRGEAQLRLRLEELVWNTAFSALPFLTHAHQGEAADSDLHCDTFLSNHVAHRASLAQGAAFLLAAETAFGAKVASVRPALPHRHQAPTFGAILAALEVPLDDARRLYLYASVRSALSAAVRLGIIGPLRAQAVHFQLHAQSEAALRESAALRAPDAVAISPLTEVCQAAHDRLYTRLFQS